MSFSPPLAETLPARVRLPDGALVAPPDCACCGAVATERSSLVARSGRELLVGYCRPCADHVAREQTRRLAAILSSALLGVSLAAGVPIVAPYFGVTACIAVTLLGAFLPLGPLYFFGKIPSGHVRRGPAAAFDAESSLLCFRRSFAEALAKSTGGELSDALGKRRFPGELGVPLACALVVAPALHVHNHPSIRTINANPETIEVFVDDRSIGLVEPSGTESPTAGLSARIPAGSRVLRAVAASGQTIAETQVDVLPGRDHLFAPAAPDTCFWLENAAYGRAAESLPRVPLEGESRFWAVPDGVLGWFVPSPPPKEGVRTTGGTSTVLRQGRCDEMPLPP